MTTESSISSSTLSSSTTKDLSQTPFIKQLAANDRPTRDAAVAALRTYLGGKRIFTKLDLLKLWKGLFYCMWMSDRPRTQQRLANDLASLIHSMSSSTALLFLECFWETMAREWNGIDVLRMDKFLLLIRRYLAASFLYLKKTGWQGEVLERWVEGVKEGVLHPTNNKIPNGIRYHLIDIYLDELEKLYPAKDGNESSDGEGEEEDKEQAGLPAPELPIDKLMEPFEVLLEKSSTKVVRIRTRDLLEDKWLVKWGYSRALPKKNKGDEIDEDEDEWGGFD